MLQSDYHKAFRSTILTYLAVIFVPVLLANSWFAFKFASAFTMADILSLGLWGLALNVLILLLTLLLLKSRIKRLMTLRQMQDLAKPSASLI